MAAIPSNRALARKDDLVFADIQMPHGGALDDKQLQSFIKMVQEEPCLLGDVRVELMGQAREKLEFMGFTGRISYPVLENETLTEEQRIKPETPMVILDAKDYMSIIYLGDKVMRNNLMRDNLGLFIMQQMAKRAPYDMEEYAVHNNVNHVDPYFRAFDGLLAQPTSHVIDVTGDPQPVTDEVFYAGRLALPSKYWRDLDNMRYYVSPKAEAAYAWSLRNRPSAAGDLLREGDPRDRCRFLGVPIRVLNTMPDHCYILTHRDNIVIGIEQTVTWETFREAEYRRTKFFLNYSFDAKYAVEDCVVLYKGLNPGAGITA